jgi:DNA (cytosine-5)-methyltransferase 1
MSDATPLYFFEFFAGGGMARLGLGPGWRCGFANDFDPKKAAAYAENFGDDHLHAGDVWDIEPDALPGHADLVWASSPCQDLSLAGKRGGLKERRSGAFYGFWRLVEALREQKRAPRMIVIENVVGLASSRKGADFQAIGRVFAEAGYNFGALEIDAARFLPQSRPRLFIIAVRQDVSPPADLVSDSGPLAIPSPFHSPAVRKAAAALPEDLAARWIWFALPQPPIRNMALKDVLEDPAYDVNWHRPHETRRLVEQMNSRNRAKLVEAEAADEGMVGAVYRRMRSEDGVRRQRAEIRFDGMAGCLRTPGGGSSRQFLLFVKRNDMLSRPMSPRETARLMGLPDDYVLPRATTSALHLTGDGVAVPVVRWLAEHLLEPVLRKSGR